MDSTFVPRRIKVTRAVRRWSPSPSAAGGVGNRSAPVRADQRLTYGIASRYRKDDCVVPAVPLPLNRGWDSRQSDWYQSYFRRRQLRR